MNVVSPSLFGLVELSQTIPENCAPVCPGQVLQYTCSANASSLYWEINSEQAGFDSNDPVNSSFNLGVFVAVLTANDGSLLSSTLTNTMIALSKHGQQVQCAGGSSSSHISIVIAGNACTVRFHGNEVTRYLCM